MKAGFYSQLFLSTSFSFLYIISLSDCFHLRDFNYNHVTMVSTLKSQKSFSYLPYLYFQLRLHLLQVSQTQQTPRWPASSCLESVLQHHLSTQVETCELPCYPSPEFYWFPNPICFTFYVSLKSSPSFPFHYWFGLGLVVSFLNAINPIWSAHSVHLPQPH